MKELACILSITCKKKQLPEKVVLLDGGTGGFHLLNEITGYEKLIIIDATADENPIGTVKMIKPKYSKDYPKALTAHDIGLKDLIEAAMLLDKLPEVFLVVVTIDPNQEVDTTLSEVISNKMPEIENQVFEILKN
jgi:hydrogenase maturation protease